MQIKPAYDTRRGPATVVDEITRHLRTRILRGELGPGARLVELDIAGRSGASQASVRDALQRLERDGLVVRRGRKGTFVTEVSAGEMSEIFLIRRIVETFAVRRAAQRVRREQIRELHLLVDRMRDTASEGDTAGVVEADMIFHQRICTWAEQPTLIRTWTLLYLQIERFLVLYDALHFADLTPIADSHLPIIEALESGDPDLSALRMEQHIDYVMKNTPHLELLSSNDPDSSGATAEPALRSRHPG